MKSCSFRIHYPGAVISVNHYLGRRRDGGLYVKRGARDYMTEVGWLAKINEVESYKLPIVVECSGRFRDERSAPDLSNLSKTTLDAIADATGINDKNMRWKDGKRIIDPGEDPMLTITISEGGQNGQA